MRHSRFELINEEFYAGHVNGRHLDELLAGGWRHFGPQFFRYNYGIHDGELRKVVPLRIRLSRFTLSKTQRRIHRRNSDLVTTIRPVHIDDETHELFERHKSRFRTGVPDSIYDFISHCPTSEPTVAMEVDVRRDGKKVAASYFDLGDTAISSVYGLFDPDERSRSLGIFTMLKEIEYAGETGKKFYYHGYAYEGESFYDYKKRFSGLETYSWYGYWRRVRSGAVP